jgi:hypothetical protein
MKIYGDVDIYLHAFLHFDMCGGECQFHGLTGYLQGINPWYILDKRLDGPQSLSGCCGQEENLLPLAEIETRFLYCPTIA